MKYLITGKSGQLARSFISQLTIASENYLAPEEKYLDITDIHRVREVVMDYRPDVIVNCAAYNFVDEAQQQQELAYRVNAAGPQILASIAHQNNALLIHFGSDYIFDGMKENGLYREEDAANPLNEYGKSKLLGEQKIQEETDKFLIFRLSWLFGEGKQNFVYKLMEWCRNNDYLKITCDEFSVPTYTQTVVEMTLKSIELGLNGIYHLTNSDFCSRYELARWILRNQGIDKFIRPVSVDFFQLPAQRPKFSAMSNSKLSDLLHVEIPTWQQVVVAFLQKKLVTNPNYS